MNVYKFLSGLYYAGMAILLVGIVMYLAELESAFYVFAAGTIPIIGIRAYNLIVGKPENRRIFMILFVSSLFMGAAAAAIFMHKSYWIIGILIAAMLDFYASFRRLH
ncbi:hypothetical protein DMA11_20090 [Marinilabiliaceae bacterium JC017]|nr:hypothetical protein DMA11_20090 [Marinilabiliaceae bacterium JC017]